MELTEWRIPPRENVFVQSLLAHGFELRRGRKNLKWQPGYIIPATRREDATGIDFWIKMPQCSRLIPIQVTQRGAKFFRKYRKPDKTAFLRFITDADQRISKKRIRCQEQGVAFLLVRDFAGSLSTPSLANADMRVLEQAVRSFDSERTKQRFNGAKKERRLP